MTSIPQGLLFGVETAMCPSGRRDSCKRMKDLWPHCSPRSWENTRKIIAYYKNECSVSNYAQVIMETYKPQTHAKEWRQFRLHHDNFDVNELSHFSSTSSSRTPVPLPRTTPSYPQPPNLALQGLLGTSPWKGLTSAGARLAIKRQ